MSVLDAKYEMLRLSFIPFNPIFPLILDRKHLFFGIEKIQADTLEFKDIFAKQNEDFTQ